MESNEPSHQQVIEAHLNLLLDSYENADVVYALWRIIDFKYPFLRLVRVDDLNTLHVHLNDVANHLNDVDSQLNGAIQTIMRQSSGRSMMDKLLTTKAATERASSCTNDALNLLSSLPTRMLI